MHRFIRLSSLKQRIFLSVGYCITLCLLLVIGVSYTAMRSVEETKIQTSIISDLDNLSRLMDDNYYAVLQLSQQMESVGSLGRKYDAYLTAEDQYDRIIAYRDFQESLGIARFGGRNILIASYLLDNQTPAYTNFSLRQDFDLRTFEVPLFTDEITFHAMHPSQNGVVDKMVVSISRPVSFSDGSTQAVYLESFTDIESFLQNTDYTFLQTDETGRICYSNGDFSIGEQIQLPAEGSFTVQNDYAQSAIQSQFGFYYLLLIPEQEYAREMILWKQNILIVAVISLALLTITAFFAVQLIYRPISRLKIEMAQVGNGNFSPSNPNYKIREFDDLFTHFNRMKSEISRLIDDIRQKDQQNHQLELDKLYYQINPHFLMNTLNTAHWMAVANGQKEIDQYINQLNYILGYSLGKTEMSTSFRTEIKSVKVYLELQKMRYDFTYHLDIEDGDYLNWPSARLILQPIAENAVCHNMDEFGNFWLTIKKETLFEKEWVHIIMRDDGKGFHQSETETQNQGIGLRYVQYTLHAFYQGREKFDIRSIPGEGTTVDMLLPFEKGE